MPTAYRICREAIGAKMSADAFLDAPQVRKQFRRPMLAIGLPPIAVKKGVSVGLCWMYRMVERRTSQLVS